MRLNTIKRFIDKKILITLNNTDDLEFLRNSLNSTKGKFIDIIKSLGFSPSYQILEIEDISNSRVKYSNYMVWHIQRRINDTYDYLEYNDLDGYFPFLDNKSRFKTILFREHLSGEIDYYNDIKEV